MRAGWKQRQEVEQLYSTGDEGAACHLVLYPCPHPQASALQVARVIVSTMSSAGVRKRTEQPGCPHNQPGKWASRQRGTAALAGGLDVRPVWILMMRKPHKNSIG